jgi:hypothetical protein
MYDDKIRDLDEQIQDLLEKISCKEPHSSTLSRKKALTQLLIYIQRSPRLFRRSHQDYSYALNLTLTWVSENIQNFSPRSQSVSEDLMHWVNGYLRWRVQDLYSSGTQGPETIELDKPIMDREGNQTTRGDITADPSRGGMSILDQWIEEIQKDEQEHISQRIGEYIRNDPHEILKKCHPKKYPECNCQELVIRIHLHDPPETIRAIANQFDIDEQTLYSHWRKKCLALLQIIALRFDPQVQAYVQQDPDNYLNACCIEGLEICSCRELSELFLLSKQPETMKAIARTLNVKESTLTKHWQEKCLPILKKYRL